MDNGRNNYVSETKIIEAVKRPLTEIEKEDRVKRRKMKKADAPKLPRLGYVRFMNERREVLRKEFPNKTPGDHIKIIGEEWSQMPDEKKLTYIEAAEVEKERYTAELKNYLNTNSSILPNEIGKNKMPKIISAKSNLQDKHDTLVEQSDEKESSNLMTDKDLQEEFVSPKSMPRDKCSKRKRIPTPTSTCTVTNSVPTITSVNFVKSAAGEIPIFTPEFLEHNKRYEIELRNLRKSKSDLEQQNAVLEKHVENMKFGVEKMSAENDQLEEKNRLLEIYLDKLKHKLANALSGLSIPTEPNGATYENIEKYMDDLYKMATSNLHGPASLNKAKDIIRKMDLQIQF